MSVSELDLSTGTAPAVAFRFLRKGRTQQSAVAVVAPSRLDEQCRPRHAAELAQITVELADRLETWLTGDYLVFSEPDTGRIIVLFKNASIITVRSTLRDFCAGAGAQHWSTLTRHVEVAAAALVLLESEPEAVANIVEQGTTLVDAALRRRDFVCIGGRRSEREREHSPPTLRWLRMPIQIVASVLISIGVPFFIMVGLHKIGVDLATTAYISLVVALGLTAVMIWAESLRALTPLSLPALPDEAEPPCATAIIAAYLPNEADTIIDTVATLLAQDYQGDLQVIVAYNSPESLPVEDDLHALAAVNSALELLAVPDSTSKAQNINAALAITRGEFVGIFDADHHPMPSAFTRAWHWIADGVDIVQGHCVVRNGEESLIAKLVAVEFAQIYAVSHPGRASMHGFGIFGGSNGYWRTDLLKAIRMRFDRLTEDIDSSIRATLAGAQIISDPGLFSRELAPITARSLFRQRLRWAQGWFQVSRHHLAVTLRSDLSRRQKFGMAILLGWREIYPWISPTMMAVLGYLIWRDGGLSFSSPLFLITTLYTITCGPVQAVFAWRLAPPEIRRHTSWFLKYILLGTVYAEAKNLFARVAQFKELSGEHHWTVTPRTSPVIRPAFARKVLAP
jgi:cellulose synthase/poly-beta-1,6-N-acetylglucosamine synthase-like glycosyltransferase